MHQRPARKPDWQDRHEGPVSTRYVTARQAFEDGFDTLPGWVGVALRVRDRIVKPFGIATVSDGDMSMTSLPVLEETKNTYEVGLEDSNLTSLFKPIWVPGAFPSSRASGSTIGWVAFTLPPCCCRTSTSFDTQ